MPGVSVGFMRIPVLLALLVALSACSDGAESPTPQSAGSPVASRSAEPRVSSGPTPTRDASPSQSASTTSPSGAEPIRMIGDGVDLPALVVAFGTTYAEARSPLDLALGAPTLDTGPIDAAGPYGACPGSDLRVLEYGGGALQVLFGTLDGATGMTFYGWLLTEQGTAGQVPQASALVGDVTTYEFGVGTAVAELREGLGETLQLAKGDELVAPSFRVADQSSGFFGALTTTAPGGVVQYVQAGQGCRA